jgi:hypothetical protein
MQRNPEKTMRTNRQAKEESFNFRVDSRLKAEFRAATDADDVPAAQILRNFMRTYITRRNRLDFAAEAHRQSEAIAARATHPGSDESAMMAELDARLVGLSSEWN